MNTKQILNGDGKKVEINLNEINSNTYCITCGFLPNELNQLEVFQVGNTPCLKNWLEEKQHYAQEKDNILLCKECQEEAIC